MKPIVKSLLTVFLLSFSAGAQQAISFPFVPGQPPVQLTLPEGYSMREIEGIKDEAFIYCPWNEYFSIHPFRYQRIRTNRVVDEASMSAELDSFARANPTLPFHGSKVWMTSQGPRGSMELVQGEKATQIVGVYLFVPRGEELLVLTTMGTTSSAADQRFVHELFNKALKL